MPDALRWRSGEISLPAVRLSRLLGARASERTPHQETGVRLKAGSERFVLIVDDVDAALEIVLKPLPPELSLPALYAGVAILNDGDVVLALDAAGLAETFGLTTVVAARARLSAGGLAQRRPAAAGVPHRTRGLARRAAASDPVD